MNVLVKDFLRELKSSWTRFLSILMIVALGCGFFAGVRATGNDMKYTLNNYFEDTHFMDVQIMSNYGLTEDDISAIAQTEGVRRVVPAYQADVLAAFGEDNHVIRTHSLADGMNDVELISGRYPENPGECLIEHVDGSSDLALGNTLKLSSGDKDEPLSDTLNHAEYTIVGTIRSPLYISQDRPVSLIGSGWVDYYMMLPKGEFTMDVYAAAWIELDGDIFDTFSAEYEKRGEIATSVLEEIGNIREPIRMAQILEEPQQKIDDGQKELDDGRTEGEAKLADARQQIADGEQKIADAKVAYEQGQADYDNGLTDGWGKLQNAKAELQDGDSKYAQGMQDYVAGKEQLDAAKVQLDQWQAQITELENMSLLLQDVLTSGATYTPAQTSAAVAAVSAFDSSLGATVQTYLSNVQSSIPSPVEQATIQGAITDINNQVNTQKPALQAAQQDWQDNKNTLDASARLLASTKQQLEDGWANYNRGVQEYYSGKTTGQNELDTAKKAIADGEADLVTAREELAKGERELADQLAEGEAELADARQKLAELKAAAWTVESRDKMPDVEGYRANAERIDSISTVFPVFFLLIAALVCLTTMTRMVEDERMQIGTLKAIGYSNFAIAAKFVFYALSATVLGSVIGLIAGYQLFPRVIFSAYAAMMYQLPPLQMTAHVWLSLLTALVAVAMTTIATMSVAAGALRAQAATLLRPEAPKAGKRILLERVTFLWKRLSFSYKVTARNVFRYKKRMLMSIVGIAGCTALMLAGFGLRDAVGEVVPIQFSEIYHYDMTMILNEQSDNFEEVRIDIEQEKDITDHLFVQMENATIVNQDKDLGVVFMVTDQPDHIKKMIDIHDTKGNPLPLTDDGVVLTEKAAKQFGVKAGDTITLELDDKQIQAPVTGVMENYVFHYVYMTDQFYQKNFNRSIAYNRVLGTFDEQLKNDEGAQNELATRLMESDEVLTVSLSADVHQMMNDQVASLNTVIIVLVVSAGLLAFIVMYNLTNINIIERRREIASLKVLGFYDPETSAYVFRENMILSVLGSLVGLVLGVFLTRFVMGSAEVDDIMFIQKIGVLSFLYAFGLTMLFTIAVRLLMHYRLQKIDMIESLKSVE